MKCQGIATFPLRSIPDYIPFFTVVSQSTQASTYSLPSTDNLSCTHVHKRTHLTTTCMNKSPLQFAIPFFKMPHQKEPQSPTHR